MSEHDKFCPMQQGDGLCRCYILRKARADERERIAQAIESAAELHYAPSAVKRAARIARNGGSE